MLHGSAAKLEKDHATPHKQRLGVKMFIVYGLVYVGFVAINVVKPVLMEKTVLFGMNLACVYGFGLIIFALVLALIYNHMCCAFERKHNTPDTGAEGGNE